MDRRHATAFASAFALMVAFAAPARQAAAQSCGGQRSGCKACHDERGAHPVSSDGTPWHGDHAFGDFCVDCHGGDRTATDQLTAHVGRVAPLAAERCTSCHPTPEPLLARYVAARAERPAPPASALTSSEDASSSSSEVAAVATAPSPPTPTTRWPDLLALASALGLGGVLIALRTRAERRRRGLPVVPIGRALATALRAPGWSPTRAGIGLGVVITVSLAAGHRLSGAAAYQQLASTLGGALAPSSIYWHHVVGPLQMSWELWAWLGAVLGAFASALASRTFALRTMPDRGWVDIHGPSVPRRWVIAFVGSGLTAFAAGIAGGCTASLAMSGGAVLVPAAFAFMAGMFTGGIPTAWLIGRGGAS